MRRSAQQRLSVRLARGTLLATGEPIELASCALAAHVPLVSSARQRQRDGGSHHITLFSKDELKVLSAEQKQRLEAEAVEQSKIEEAEKKAAAKHNFEKEMAQITAARH